MRTSNDTDERSKSLETFQMDYGETLPHQIAELQKDLIEIMESKSTISKDMDLHFRRTSNRPHWLEGSNPPKEGEDEPRHVASDGAKARQDEKCPAKGLSDSESSTVSLSRHHRHGPIRTRAVAVRHAVRGDPEDQEDHSFPLWWVDHPRYRTA